MIDPNQLRELVIRPTLKRIKLHSRAAEDLMLATAIGESVSGGTQYLKQVGGGPALSIYQIEPATGRDVRYRYLKGKGREALRKRVEALEIPGLQLQQQLVWNLAFATAIARLVYWRVPEPLPPAGDVTAIARYWKENYNTPLGAGRVVDFAKKVRRYI